MRVEALGHALLDRGLARRSSAHPTRPLSCSAAQHHRRFRRALDLVSRCRQPASLVRTNTSRPALGSIANRRPYLRKTDVPHCHVGCWSALCAAVYRRRTARGLGLVVWRILRPRPQVLSKRRRHAAGKGCSGSLVRRRACRACHRQRPLLVVGATHPE